MVFLSKYVRLALCLKNVMHPSQDLSYLNRDLSKVVCLDTDMDHYSTHPENAVTIPKWKGDPKDSGLVAMIPFLECMPPCPDAHARIHVSHSDCHL